MGELCRLPLLYLSTFTFVNGVEVSVVRILVASVIELSNQTFTLIFWMSETLGC